LLLLFSTVAIDPCYGNTKFSHCKRKHRCCDAYLVVGNGSLDIATQTRGVAMWLLYCNDLMVIAARLRDMATNLRVVAAWIRYSNKIRNHCNKARL